MSPSHPARCASSSARRTPASRTCSPRSAPCSIPRRLRLTAADVHEGHGDVSIRVRLADGNEATPEGTPLKTTITRAATAPPVLFLPAAARAGRRRSRRARTGVRQRWPEPSSSCSSGRARRRRRTLLAVLDAVESCCSRGVGGSSSRSRNRSSSPARRRSGTAPRSARAHPRREPGHLHDALARVPQRRAAGRARLHDRSPGTGTPRPAEPVSADEDFRVMTEFDTARSELARAVVLVEGLTEKLVLPFVFSALGYDVDREAISIVECGGKPNLPRSRGSVARPASPSSSCTTATGRRAAGSFRPSRRWNVLIAETAGEERVVVLDPGLRGGRGLHGHRRAFRAPGGSSPSEARTRCRARSCGQPSWR